MIQASDFIAIFQWWIVLFIIGLGFLPLTFILFRNFFDKGYSFSKILGIILIGYPVFLLGISHIAPFHTPYIIGVAITAIGATYFFVPDKSNVWNTIKKHWLAFAIQEIMFLAVLYTWAYIHSYAPDIHGLEKFMDYGFVNSFMRTDYLPAADMWFAPLAINYYYFGHFLTAMLTKLSGLPTAITFNLMLSTIVAWCFTQSFSIGANLYYQFREKKTLSPIKTTGAGLLTTALVTFSGNLHILHAFFKPYASDNPRPLWELGFNPLAFPNEYWYPNATRFIYNTIHEFPIYSWVVADLHGHVLDIPLVLFLIALLFSQLITHVSQKTVDEKKKENQSITLVPPIILIFIGLILACMYMTNAWDSAIYFLLTALTIFAIYWKKRHDFKHTSDDLVKAIVSVRKKSPISLPDTWKILWGRDIILALLFVVAAFFVFMTPYSLKFDFSAYASGIGFLCSTDFLVEIGKLGPFIFEAEHCQRSPWWQLLLLYGFFYFFVTVFMITILRSTKHKITDVFVVLLIIVGTFLIIVPEFFYLKDIYPAHYRANTMFKLVFQAFIILSISSSYIIVRTIQSIRETNKKGKVWITLFTLTSTLLVYLVLTYPYLAIKAYYGDFKNYQGLNGQAYLGKLYPDDLAAVTWFNNNVKGQPVILEAQGDSYSDYARISSNTGLPTVLGWTVHEWLWRGGYDVPAPRITDVTTMYESPNTNDTKLLLDKYEVKYVIVGSLERQKYQKLTEVAFQQLGDIVFQQGSTKIYKIR